jgi:serine/threonine protein phosphatase PrpC
MKTKRISSVNEEDEEDLCNNLNRIVRLNSSESTTSSSSSSISQITNNSSTPIISNESPVLDDEQQCLKLIYSISGKSKHSSHITTVSTTSANLFNFGDDAIFEHENDDYYFFGLADGVSGNTKKGFDAKLFPLALLSISQFVLENEYENSLKSSIASNTLLFDLLCKSHQLVQDRQVYGSSTVCMLTLNKSSFVLNTLNLGDSGYLIIRDNQVFYKSVAQSHRYNAPFQIGCTPPELFEIDLYRDMPEDSICLQHSLKTGDFLLLSSDGLFDNLYEDEIALILQNNVVCRRKKNNFFK